MKKLPLGIQNFREIAEGGYVYVDKTEHIYSLINSAKYYFLSRPRRFGKSLLIDTIGEVFEGEKELFKGLWIYDSDCDFAKHPVIRFDMSNIANENSETLKKSITSSLRKRISEEGLDISEDAPSDMFKHLIEDLHRKYDLRVVVLIDEYDKPILDHITDPPIAEANRKVLSGFYGILKSMDAHLRFTFITGVTKFTKTSIFSGLNHLTDITMDEDYANICGIPIDSLGEYFGEHIESLKTHKRFMHCDAIEARILEWYDGYSWDGETKLLNPFSLLNFFHAKKFSAFWYASGSPRFLLDLIRGNPERYSNYNKFAITEAMLDAVEIEKIDLESLLFQTGYLTVKDIPETRGIPVYELKIPNFEVREVFNIHIVAALTENDNVSTGRMRMAVDEALRTGDLQRMLDILRGFFASIPHNLHVGLEAYYHSLFYALMSAIGFDTDVEVSVSKGRVDAVLELDDKVYVMEFKYKSCPPDADEEEKQKLFEKALNEAVEQINNRGYGDKFIGSGKEIYKAAFAFIGRGEIEMMAWQDAAPRA